MVYQYKEKCPEFMLVVYLKVQMDYRVPSKTNNYEIKIYSLYWQSK